MEEKPRSIKSTKQLIWASLDEYKQLLWIFIKKIKKLKNPRENQNMKIYFSVGRTIDVD